MILYCFPFVDHSRDPLIIFLLVCLILFSVGEGGGEREHRQQIGGRKVRGKINCKRVAIFCPYFTNYFDLSL